MQPPAGEGQKERLSSRRSIGVKGGAIVDFPHLLPGLLVSFVSLCIRVHNKDQKRESMVLCIMRLLVRLGSPVGGLSGSAIAR